MAIKVSNQIKNITIRFSYYSNELIRVEKFTNFTKSKNGQNTFLPHMHPKTYTYIPHTLKDKTGAYYLSNKLEMSKIEQCLGPLILSTERQTNRWTDTDKGMRAAWQIFFFLLNIILLRGYKAVSPIPFISS